MKRMMDGELGSRWSVRLMTTRFRIVLATLAAALWAAAVQPAFGAETLRWKFNPGETLRYTMVQERIQVTKPMAPELKTNQELKTSLNQTVTVNLHWSVKSVSSDGLAELSQTIDRVRTKVEAPGSSFEFDSDSGKVPEGPIADQLVPLLKAIVAAEFTFKMNGRGELSDIKVPQKLLDALRQAGPAATAGGMFSDEGLKNLISQSSLTLPEASLDRGKTWTQQTKVPVPMLGTMVMDKTYTFEGPDSKDAGLLQILLDNKVTLEPAADSNVAVKITSQEGKGQFSFDAQAGRVVSSRVDDRLQMSLSIMGQELQQSTDTVTTMTLAKDGTSK